MQNNFVLLNCAVIFDTVGWPYVYTFVSKSGSMWLESVHSEEVWCLNSFPFSVFKVT